jgi:hypothetical protein
MFSGFVKYMLCKYFLPVWGFSCHSLNSALQKVENF